MAPPGFKTSYKTIGTKTAWYRHKNAHTDWNKTADTETKPGDNQVMHEKEAKNIIWTKAGLFSK